ncbi:phytolongin Phyl2.2-like [Durio zibethinus]|uniref:Phytolongin Phyl2.2-like n=1 Tax=Durio zibethinus TaxID=66656 RepID=A0A6P6B9G2_DURZI|nr:phytolongin Phyl2.2-like [Durio zibethinus]
MISNPNLIFYACIAKGPTILAEFSCKEAGIESLAQKCIEKTPLFHSIFSQTVSNRTYTFLIDDPFAYFLIFHENLEKSESFCFLDHLKYAFEDFLLTGLIVGTDNFTPNCLQSHFNPIFSKIMAMDLELVTSPTKASQNPTLDSNKGKRTVVAPRVGKPIKGLKKKKRSGGLEVNGVEAKDAGGGIGMEDKVDVSDDFRDFPVSIQKSGAAGFYMGSGDRQQKAKQTWSKHVWVVLILDLLVCATLFGIWLWVCRGFQCIDG